MEVMCHVDGCERVAMYKAKRLCQKHYFRMMRTGSYELKRKIERLVTPNGYIKVLAEGHKLSDKHGYVYEHRLVLFNKYGDSELACEKCGARWLWRPYMDHVDHIDKNKQNNKASNLRPLCNGCNTKRTKIDYTKVKGLSSEVIEKLSKHRPVNLGQASRIQGITPAAISLLRIHLKKLSLLFQKSA